MTKITQTHTLRLDLRTTPTLWIDPRSNHTLRAEATITLTTSTTVKATSVSKNSHRVDHTMAMTCFCSVFWGELYSSYCTQGILMSDQAFHHFLQELFPVHKLFLTISHGIWKSIHCFSFVVCFFPWKMTCELFIGHEPETWRSILNWWEAAWCCFLFPIMLHLFTWLFWFL